MPSKMLTIKLIEFAMRNPSSKERLPFKRRIITVPPDHAHAEVESWCLDIAPGDSHADNDPVQRSQPSTMRPITDTSIARKNK